MKPFRKALYIAVTVLAAGILLCSCGSNESHESGDKQKQENEKALRALEEIEGINESIIQLLGGPANPGKQQQPQGQNDGKDKTQETPEGQENTQPQENPQQEGGQQQDRQEGMQQEQGKENRAMGIRNRKKASRARSRSRDRNRARGKNNSRKVQSRVGRNRAAQARTKNPGTRYGMKSTKTLLNSIPNSTNIFLLQQSSGPAQRWGKTQEML